MKSPEVAPGDAGQPSVAAADSAPGGRVSDYQASPALVPLQSPPLPSSATALHPVAAAHRVPQPVDSASSKSSRHLPHSSAFLPSPPAGVPGNIRIIQDLLGLSDIQAAVIHAQGLSRGLSGDASPGVSL